MQDFTWRDGERVMFLGDSLLSDEHGYAHLIEEMVAARYPDLNITYMVHDMGGNRISDVFERLDRDVFDGAPSPTWIGVELGLNDIWHNASGTPIGRFRDLYGTVLRRLLDTKATVVAYTTTVIGEELENESNREIAYYNDAIREIAFGLGIPVVDMNAAFRDGLQQAQSRGLLDFYYTIDGMHLNERGTMLAAMMILRSLNFSLPTLNYGFYGGQTGEERAA